MKNSLFLFALAFSLRVFSQEAVLTPPKNPIDILDCACSTSNNPLKGISAFTVLLSEKSPEIELFIEELEKVGKVKRISTADPKGIDFEGMGTGARLTLLLTPLSVLGEANSEITRIALYLSMSVEVLKTKNQIESYIWATNLFSTKNSKGESVKKAAQQFATYYAEANPTSKPMFYVYF
jgi:hypothetical protein